MATASVSCDLDQIGETAGVVWRLLDSSGPMSMAKIIKDSGAPRDVVLLALGWLAREDKIAIDSESRGRMVSLRS